MSKDSEETTAIITLGEETSIDAQVLGAHIQRQLNMSGFELTHLRMMDDAGFRLAGPLLQLVFYLDKGEPNGFLVTVLGADGTAPQKKLRRERFRLCSAVVDLLLEAVSANRVAMYHSGVSYVTERGKDIVVRRDRSARLRQRPEAARRRGRGLAEMADRRLRSVYP